MDLSQARLLRDVLGGTGWVERTEEFTRSLRVSTRSPGGLLLVGPPRAEPWHLTAHLDDEARWGDVPELAPTLVRWNPPSGVAPQLAIGLDRLTETRKGESLLVVSEDAAPAPLLERVDDVRRKGARVFALDKGDPELGSLAHDVLSIEAEEEPLLSFDSAQHLVSLAAGDPVQPAPKRGVRSRLGRLLDVIAGPG